MTNERALLGLIDKIYLCGSGNADWQEFTDEYARLFPSLKSALAGYDRQFTDAAIFCSTNYDPQFMQSYEAYYYKINPWKDVLAHAPMSPNVSWGAEVPLREVRRTEFYSDWIRPQEDVVRGFTTVLFRERDRLVSLTPNVNPKHIEEARAAADCIKLIGPHLQRALELSRQLTGLRVQNATMRGALDALAASAFVVGADVRLEYANARAEALLSVGRLVRRDAAGRLRFVHADDHRAVMTCVHLAGSLATTGPRMVPLRGGGEPAYLAFVSPLVTEPHARSRSLLPPKRCAIVFVVDPRETPRARAEQVAAALGITPAEAQLALAMLHDKTLQDYADERRISINTARVQMRSLLDKTDTHRQASLVSLLVKIFGTLAVP